MADLKRLSSLTEAVEQHRRDYEEAKQEEKQSKGIFEQFYRSLESRFSLRNATLEKRMYQQDITKNFPNLPAHIASEVENLLTTPIVKTVLDLEVFDMKHVQLVLIRRVLNFGRPFDDVNSMYKACLKENPDKWNQKLTRQSFFNSFVNKETSWKDTWTKNFSKWAGSFLGRMPKKLKSLLMLFTISVVLLSTPVAGREQTTNYQLQGVNFHFPPSYPNYVTITKRLQTFVNWPGMHHPPWSMAEAGFFYNGTRDQVCCFSCACVLENWGPGDDPWTIHADATKSSYLGDSISKCTYLTLNPPETHLPAPSNLSSLIHHNDSDIPYNATKESATMESDTAEISSLEEENERLKAAGLCAICRQNEKGILFLPCKHIVCCPKCCFISNCPACQKEIRHIKRIYM